MALVEMIGAASSVRAVELLRPMDHHDDGLIAAIDRACRAVRVRPRDLTRIAVSIGPGGFTALRIAAATAKVLGEAIGAPCVSVPTAEIVARRVEAPSPFAVALASKGDSAHLTLFRGAGDDRGTTLGIARAGDLERLGIVSLIADKFLPKPMADECARLGIERHRPIFDPVACAEIAAARDPIDPVNLLPLYPREPEAVALWRQRQG